MKELKGNIQISKINIFSRKNRGKLSLKIQLMLKIISKECKKLSTSMKGYYMYNNNMKSQLHKIKRIRKS